MNPFRPVNREAEAAALGCALIDENAARLLSKVPADYFTSGKNKALHVAIRECVQGDTVVDPFTLQPILTKAGKWSDAPDANGAVSMLDVLALMDKAGPAIATKAYIDLMRSAWRQRRIVKACQSLLDSAQERFLDREELSALEESFQQAAFSLVTSESDDRRPRSMGEILPQVFETIEARVDGKISRYGLPTPIEKLNHYTTGFHPGQLIIVCGRPGHGKTSFALDLAAHAASDSLVCFFSLEMSADELTQRLLAKRASVNIRNVRSGNLQRSDLDRVITAMGDLEDCGLVIDDSAALSPAQIRFRVRETSSRLKRPVGLIVVDYLQLMSPSKKQDSREQVIASISREMKQLAKELTVPVVLLSQLNRQLEQRADKRPQLADLRESGAIEQDADLVLALFQPYLYTNSDEDRNKAECLILKQRSGPVGMLPLHWSPETATFSDPFR
jgi:replicative DNA helicase